MLTAAAAMLTTGLRVQGVELSGDPLSGDPLFAVDQSASVIVDGIRAPVYDLNTHSPQKSDRKPHGVRPLLEADPWLLHMQQVPPPPAVPSVVAPPMPLMAVAAALCSCGCGPASCRASATHPVPCAMHVEYHTSRFVVSWTGRVQCTLSLQMYVVAVTGRLWFE